MRSPHNGAGGSCCASPARGCACSVSMRRKSETSSSPTCTTTMRETWLNSPAHAYDIESVLAMVRLVYGAQVQFHDGDAEVAPGISVHHVGGHTHGLQVVR